jgi:hypothetical protein
MERKKLAWQKSLLSYCNQPEEYNRPKPKNYSRGLEGGSMGNVSPVYLVHLVYFVHLVGLV